MIPRVPPDALFRGPLHHSPGPAHGLYARLPLQLRHRRAYLPRTHAPIAGAPKAASLPQKPPVLRLLIQWEEELASPAWAQGAYRPELLRSVLETAACFSTDTASRRQRESGSPVVRHRPGRQPSRNRAQEKRPDAGVRSSPHRPRANDGSWPQLARCQIAGAKARIRRHQSGMRSLKYAWIFGELWPPFEARYPLADVHSG